MDELFIKKVRTAATAGWLTLLIACGFLFLLWVMYLLVISRQPDWMLCFWGRGVTWDDVQSIWLWAMGAFKIGVWFIALFVIWLTIWAKKLQKQ